MKNMAQISRWIGLKYHTFECTFSLNILETWEKAVVCKPSPIPAAPILNTPILPSFLQPSLSLSLSRQISNAS